MKTDVSIKFSSIEEYREIEKKLEELGYVNDRIRNITMINLISKGFVFLNKKKFEVWKLEEFPKQYNSLEEFLKD